MAEEDIIKYSHQPPPGDLPPPDWEAEIIDAPRGAPRKSVWVPMENTVRYWYISQERNVHDLVNSVLREYMESEIARQRPEAESE